MSPLECAGRADPRRRYTRHRASSRHRRDLGLFRARVAAYTPTPRSALPFGRLGLGHRGASEASVQRSAIGLFAVLFFLSGVAGLIYEVTWTRLLRLPMGNTVHSMTTVLAAFMGGLARGAWIAGRWIERRGSPFGTYAKLEAAIGLFCFVLPWLVQAETPFFRWAYQQFADTPMVLHLLKLVGCGFVVLVPATLMGATLPVLCRAFIDDATRIGAGVGTLYAVNAAGAAAGALLAGFVLVPELGLRGAMRVGV